MSALFGETKYEHNNGHLTVSGCPRFITPKVFQDGKYFGIKYGEDVILEAKYNEIVRHQIGLIQDLSDGNSVKWIFFLTKGKSTYWFLSNIDTNKRNNTTKLGTEWIKKMSPKLNILNTSRDYDLLLVKTKTGIGLYNPFESKYILEPIYDDYKVCFYSEKDSRSTSIIFEGRDLIVFTKDDKTYLFSFESGISQAFDEVDLPLYLSWEDVIVKNNGKQGVYTQEDGVIIPMEYDDVTLSSKTNAYYGHHAIVKKDNKYGLYLYDSSRFGSYCNQAIDCKYKAYMLISIRTVWFLDFRNKIHKFGYNNEKLHKDTWDWYDAKQYERWLKEKA